MLQLIYFHKRESEHMLSFSFIKIINSDYILILIYSKKFCI